MKIKKLRKKVLKEKKKNESRLYLGGRKYSKRKIEDLKSRGFIWDNEIHRWKIEF